MVDLSAGQAAVSMKRRRYKPKPFKPISHDKFKHTRYLARLTKEEVACLLHVTPRTVALWEAGKSRIPYAAFKLLRISVGFELPGDAWKGWSIRGDTLWSPEERPFTAGYLGYQWLTFAMADSWRREHRHVDPPSSEMAMQASMTSPVQRPVVLRLVG
jgi:DNA-binding transcriptional regulator YiaG